jgi:hypothetical protein
MSDDVVEFKVGEDDGQPPVQVELTFDRIVCARHGEPFRADWPTGFPTFSLALFEELTKDQQFADVVGKHTNLIHEALDHQPMCERLPKLTLYGAYLKSGLGTEDLCEGCGKRGLGTEYRTKTGPSTTHTYRHLCFNCVVYQLRVMS